jgi:hypothetical protein
MTSSTAAQRHPRLLKLIETASGTVEKIFAMSGGVAAMFHYIKENGDHIVTLAPTNLDKDTGVALMRSVFELERAVAVMYIDEAWTFLSTDWNEVRAHIESGVGVAEHPRRIEIVHFSAEDDTGSLLGVRRIERPPGQKPQLGPLEIEESNGMSVGRFVGLLPRPQNARLQ